MWHISQIGKYDKTREETSKAIDYGCYNAVPNKENQLKNVDKLLNLDFR